MTPKTSQLLGQTITALRKDGYMVLMIAFDRKADDHRPLGEAMEIIFSESQDPAVVSHMAREALSVLGESKAMNPTLMT